MNKIIGSLSMGFGTYWTLQSGVLSSKPEVIVDRVLALIGAGSLGCGLYLIGAINGYNHGFRKGTQQVIRHHNDCRKNEK